MRLYALLGPVIVMLLLGVRCAVDPMAGNASETGNPTVVGVLYEPQGKNAAAGVPVVIRSKGMLAGYPGDEAPVIAISDSILTDESGRFTFDSSVNPGIYVIEAGKDGDAVLIDPVIVVSKSLTVFLPPDTLEPTGAINGIVRLSEGEDPRKTVVSAYGFDRTAAVGINGSFEFTGLPEGRYHLVLWSAFDDYGVVDTQNIMVWSAETTDIGVIDLPFSGIPTIKGLAALYDTLLQEVTLSWERPKSGLAKTFNVYRRVADPPSAVFTQLNVFPVMDTGYTDTRCEPDKTYEYRITAVDSNTNEGKRSDGVCVVIAVYDVKPGQVTVTYDTLRQIISLQWDDPDPSLVTGYNIYRRNIGLGETFRTPLNNRPTGETVFIDSSFALYPDSDVRDPDSTGFDGPSYEYCVRAVIREVREGANSVSDTVRVSLRLILPTGIRADYDSLMRTVRLCWNVADTTQVQGFAVFRRDFNADGNGLTRLPGAPFIADCFTDSTVTKNRAYEYRIASILKNARATVMGAGVKVRLAASNEVNMSPDDTDVH